MTAIRLDLWNSVYSRDQRLKIACAYTVQFKRADCREALLNNQYQDPALDRLEAFMIPLIGGATSPGSWSLDQCNAVLGQPLTVLVSINLAAYWHVMTAERKTKVRARVVAALAKVGIRSEIIPALGVKMMAGAPL